MTERDHADPCDGPDDRRMCPRRPGAQVAYYRPDAQGGGGGSIAAVNPPGEASMAAGEVPRTSRGWVWLGLCCSLLAALLITVPELATSPIQNEHEATNVITAVETWHRQGRIAPSGSWMDSFVPVRYGVFAVDQPPGLTWLHVAALTVTGVDVTKPGHVIWSLRFSSVFMLLVMLASVFWAGYSMWGMRTALIATMICLAMPFLIWQSRYATVHLPQLAMMTLAMAAALWSIRPFKPAPPIWRLIVGWLVCGLALAGTFFIGGLWAANGVVLPLIGVAVLCPRRLSHAMGLLAAVAVAGMLVMPWALYEQVLKTPAASGPSLTLVFLPLGDQTWVGFSQLVIWRAMWMLIVLLPWTLWLLAVYLQPFSTSSSDARHRMLIGWLWLLILSVVLGFTSSGHVPIDDFMIMIMVVPVAALAVAQTLTQFSRLASGGRHANLWQVIKWPFLATLALATLSVLGLFHYRDWFVERGWMVEGFEHHFSQALLLALMLTGLLLFYMCLRYASLQQPVRTIGLATSWVAVLFMLVAIPYGRSLQAQSQYHAASLVGSLNTGHSLLLMLVDDTDPARASATSWPDPVFLAGLQTPALPVLEKDLRDYFSDPQYIFVLCPQEKTQSLRELSAVNVHPSGLQGWDLLLIRK